MATLVNRVTGRQIDSYDDLLAGMLTFSDNMNQTIGYYLDMQEATNSHRYTGENDTESWAELMKNREWNLLEKIDATPSDVY